MLHAGTHDNETAVGWWADSATDVDRAFLEKYTGGGGEDIAWLFIRSALASVSRTSIVLMQARRDGPPPRLMLHARAGACRPSTWAPVPLLGASARASAILAVSGDATCSSTQLG